MKGNNKFKKIDKKDLKKRFTNYLVTFVTIFTVMVVGYVAISLFVFDQFNIHFYYLCVIALLSLFEALVIELFVRIDNITIYGQCAVIYSVCALSCFALAFIINSSLLTNSLFWLVSLPASFIGLAFLLVILFIIKHNEENALNESLNRFKEDKHNEK